MDCSKAFLSHTRSRYSWFIPGMFILRDQIFALHRIFKKLDRFKPYLGEPPNPMRGKGKMGTIRGEVA